MNAANLLRGSGIVPVIVLDDPQIALPLAQSLYEAGLRVLELTLRTGSALQCLERMAAGMPEALVGAGSVRTVAQMRQARDAGARFAVSPGSSDALVAAAGELGMPFVPGAVTATEVMGLLDRGYTLQKFFPAEIAGGVAALKAFNGPLPEVSFFPTGGISRERAGEYLGLPNVSCVGGTWIVPPSLLRAGDLGAIGQLAREAAQLTA